MIRHAKAGSRKDFDGDDTFRPLTRPGWDQSRRLVKLLKPYEPKRLLSSPFTRCRQTVEPLADDAGVEVEPAEELAEGRAGKAIALVASLAGGPPVALCTHGDIVWELVEDLAKRKVLPAFREDFEKGSTWVVQVKGGIPVKARYIPAP